ncbi:ABC transporter B family member 11-like isoform X1 [Salvia splendens]|uniref:ABC transporter B family member 11-like isoform X1 n=1 Tax=Salvia splendens TaxID=180675 RepID=UPI001C272C89|nr:ABC transporter B family member 11-like isoform X1 [Salvia splendens]
MANMESAPSSSIFSVADSTDKVLMLVGTVGAIGHGLSVPLMALIFGSLVNAFEQSQTKNTVPMVSEVSLEFVYLALGCGLASFLQVSCWTITGERQSARIRRLYLQAILRQDIAYFDEKVSTGEIIEKMSSDTNLIHDAIGEKAGKFVQVVTTLLGGFVVAFAKGWLLALVMFSVLPLTVMSSVVIYSLGFKINSLAQKARNDAANVVHQTFGCIRTVASFNGEKQAVASYKKFLASSYKFDMFAVLSGGSEFGFHMFTMFCTYAMAVWFGAKMIIHNGYTGGEVYTVLLAMIMGSSSLGHVSRPLAAFAAGKAAALSMFETINRTLSIDAYDTRGKILNDIRGDIELKCVTFSYPTRPKELIFDSFSLFIPNGTTVALVGQSGSGKSTIISLIERFYDPVLGEVLIDGTDLREFKLKWIRSKIGLVSQEPLLFNASIKENIAYGKDEATSDQIRAAADLANAKDFIDMLPQGMDTVVGERGVQLSGGQKQRVAIARAIIKDPRILLLDEATSALDGDSERVVQEALEKIKMNRTTVIVAHRLSTIRNANLIVVLHQGKLVEKGTHAELLKDPQGMYSNLICSQEVNNKLEQNIDDRYITCATRFGLESSRSLGMASSSPGSLSISSSKTALDVKSSFSTDTSEYHPEVSLYRLAHLNKPEALVLIAGAVVAVITGAILPVFGLLTSIMIKTFFELPDKMRKDSEFWALMFLILGIVALVAYSLRSYLFGVAGNKLIKRIREMCFEKLVSMEIEWFDMAKNSSGVISARLSTDAAMIRALVGDALAQIVQEIASLLVGFAIAFEACWQLALIVGAMMPLLGLNTYVQMKSAKGFIKEAKLMNERASQVANDAVGNMRTVASFCAQEKIMEIYKEKCEGPASSGTKPGLIGGIGFGASMCFLYLVYAASFYAGGRLVEDGKTTTANVFCVRLHGSVSSHCAHLHNAVLANTQVFFVLSMVATAISTWSAMAPDSGKAKAAAASIFAILDGKSKLDPRHESGITLENIDGEIEFRHVYFSYPSRPDIQILKDLSLTVSSRKMVGLVGESGSGKSTVISLLQRFYEYDSGHITLDGIEIHKLQLKWLRQQMGLVNQEPVLFNDTIRANIAYGKGESPTEAEIIAAAKSANAHEFISGLNQGYDTVVGERGVHLSGGQKQRVAIARAIIKKPKILLLDEATSALDAESEKIVQEALDRVMVNRSTIVVAHRLSTIRGADSIAVFKNGCIVEKGNHQSLINIKDGYYSSLVKLHHAALP